MFKASLRRHEKAHGRTAYRRVIMYSTIAPGCRTDERTEKMARNRRDRLVGIDLVVREREKDERDTSSVQFNI